MTTRLPSSLLLNPPTQQASTLKQWYNQNCQEVTAMVEKGSYKDSAQLLPPLEDSDINSVRNALNTLKNAKTAWIQGNATLATGQRSFWYSACANCQKAVDAPIGMGHEMPLVQGRSGVEARCCIGIFLDDGTASVNAIVFGFYAEKLIPYSGVQLSEAEQLGLKVLPQMAAAINNRQLLCFVRHFDSEYQGQRDAKNVVKVYTVEELTRTYSPTSSMITDCLTTKIAAPIAPTDGQPVLRPESATSPESSQKTPVNKQLLTPTAKEVLATIGWGSSSTKRNLNFELSSTSSATTPDKRLDMFSAADAERGSNEGKELIPPKTIERIPLKKHRTKV